MVNSKRIEECSIIYGGMLGKNLTVIKVEKSLQVASREPYYHIIKRLIKFYKKHGGDHGK
jgi:hypothetical protein